MEVGRRLYGPVPKWGLSHRGGDRSVDPCDEDFDETTALYGHLFVKKV